MKDTTTRTTATLTLTPNGDPYGSGYVAIEGDPKADTGTYRGDLGAQSRTWWRWYARRNNYNLRWR